MREVRELARRNTHETARKILSVILADEAATTCMTNFLRGKPSRRRDEVCSFRRTDPPRHAVSADFWVSGGGGAAASCVGQRAWRSHPSHRHDAGPSLPASCPRAGPCTLLALLRSRYTMLRIRPGLGLALPHRDTGNNSLSCGIHTTTPEHAMCAPDCGTQAVVALLQEGSERGPEVPDPSTRFRANLKFCISLTVSGRDVHVNRPGRSRRNQTKTKQKKLSLTRI
eukprot:2046897-Rhodomonas_salina.2